MEQQQTKNNRLTAAVILLISLLIFAVSTCYNVMMAKTKEKHNMTTTGIVTSDVKESSHTRTIRTGKHSRRKIVVLDYQAEVTYTVDNNTYHTVVYDSSESGRDAYFSKGSQVIVNYVDSNPSDGMVFKGNPSLHYTFMWPLLSLTMPVLFVCGKIAQVKKNSSGISSDQ